MGKLHDLAVNSAPRFKCLIPSTGKMAQLRAFVVKEQKLLLMAKEAENNPSEAIIGAVTQLIQNCVVGDLDISTLPSFDVEYMFVQLFMNSAATKTTFAHYQCKANRKDADGNDVLDADEIPVACNEINKIKIDLSVAKIPVADIKDGIIEVNSETISKIVFTYPSFDQSTKIESSLASDNVDAAFMTYASCMKAVYKKDGSMMALGEDYDVEDGVELLEYMSSEVFEKITSFFNDAPTITAEVPYKCKTCGVEATLKLRGLEDFF